MKHLPLFLCLILLISCKNKNHQNEAQIIDCPACKGTTRCLFCNRSGMVEDFSTGLMQRCPSCKGFIVCSNCKGSGKILVSNNTDEQQFINQLEPIQEQLNEPSDFNEQEFDTHNCNSCNGSGICWRCGGRAVVPIETGLAQQDIIDCSECVGGRCSECGGRGHI